MIFRSSISNIPKVSIVKIFLKTPSLPQADYTTSPSCFRYSKKGTPACNPKLQSPNHVMYIQYPAAGSPKFRDQGARGSKDLRIIGYLGFGS